MKYRNLMWEAWSGIDVFLKKRHDLVPNIVEVVKSYALHEKNTFEAITRYRSDAMQANNTENQVVSENRLAKELGNLWVVVENYPELKANAHFLQLQQQLADIEHDLEASRRYYNGTVRIHNIYVEKFPSNMMAWLFRFKKGIFFAAAAGEKEAPELS
ncbi:MAG: LemA family protein [Lentimicrobiaceae bacterium]|nr:LemA family protein [Lentimicrobiaceae bacterium]